MVVRIDGSQHTGGGGVLRVALGLSMLTGEPLSMTNIRSNRSNPGLGHQHLAAVKLASQVCSASTEGAELRSEKLLFMPSRLEEGSYEFDITTAGSIPLALQPVLLAGAFSGKRFSFHIKGGTDVPHAPSADYLRSIFLPSIRMLARSEADVLERGFAPKGNGRMIVRLNSEYSKLTALPPINYATPGSPVKLEFRIVSTNDLEDTREHLLLAGRSIGIDTSVHVSRARSQSPGTVSTIIIHQGPMQRTIGASMLDESMLAETLFAHAKKLLHEPCDEHLADQLIPYLAAHHGALHHPLTEHMHAALAVTEAFLPGRLEVDEENGIIRSR